MDEVTEALDEIRSIVSTDTDKFYTDRRARYSLRYSVIMIVEALADLLLFLKRILMILLKAIGRLSSSLKA